MNDPSSPPRYSVSGADFSPCGRYRYTLHRGWDRARGDVGPTERRHWWTNADGSAVVDGAGTQLSDSKVCYFIMLNPSTADGLNDDPTIRRCVQFAKRWGYESMTVLNLFAYRASDPRTLKKLNSDDDPIGPRNSEYFENEFMCKNTVGHVVCAWGTHGGHLDQDQTVLGWLDGQRTYVLGLTKDGFPRHPLYVRADAELRLWNGR